MNIDNIVIDGTEYSLSSGSGLTADVKQALLDCFDHVVWDDDDPTGQSYIDALESALYPPVNLVSISAVYTQSGIVYTTDSLDSLRNDLVVTAHWDNSTTSIINNYILIGTLEEGTNTITVSYGGKNTTFTVTAIVWSTSPIIEYTKSALISGGAIQTTDDKGVTIEYEVDEVSASQRNITVALFYPWDNYGGSNWQSLPHACYLSGQSEEDGNGEKYSTRSTYGLDSNGDLPSTITESDIILKANAERVRFTIPSVNNPTTEYQTNAKEYCYAYIKQSGYILFAGSETPYYGMSNISEANS